jgi:putative nucleotidyltransferase with HDIG domain
MARVLLLGADRVRGTALHDLLARDGHTVTRPRTAQDWSEHERKSSPDVVVATLEHPNELGAVAGSPSPCFSPPVLFVEPEADFLREPQCEGRFVDCLVSPFMGEEFLARVDALARVRQIVVGESRLAGGAMGRGWSVVRRRLSSWLKTRLPERERPVGPYLEVATRVAEWVDRRDAFEPGHANRVSSLCEMIAEALLMDEQETTELLRAAVLHDIGKVGLPTGILRQRRPLEEEQVRLIRTHPARGADLLRALDPDESVARIVRHHHERPDGTGYYGKQRGSVPRAAYALAVAEAYDGMTSSLLGDTLDSVTALDLMLSGRDTAYDADCVEALADALRPRARSVPLASS